MAARELNRLQGVWRLDGQILNGERSPESKTRAWVLVIEGDIYSPGSRESSVEYLIRLDPTRTPKAIDFIPKDGSRRGRTLRGIYSLDDATLTICRVLDPDLDRPTAFESGEDSGLVLLTWKRGER